MAEPEHPATNDTETSGEKQCRICFDGEDLQLGRLIRPCLCKGSISHVHVKCLQQWRNSAPNSGAFYACPQCGYRYHFARTRVVGIATNPVVVAALSSILFTFLVLCCSFVTTWFLSEDDASGYTYSVYYPYEIFQHLVRATIRAFVDDEFLEESIVRQIRDSSGSKSGSPPGVLKRFVRRFLLGLPVVGAGSIAHMLLSIPLPFHWFRIRTRVSRGSRDVVALAMVALVLAGAARALWKVFKLTERLTGYLLLRAEDAILEVG